MKITIYELLGLIKDGKAPKKIKYKNNIYEYDGEIQNYCSPINMIWNFLIKEDIVALLDDEVEIIEKPKKIEKLNDKLGLFGDGNTQKIINELNYTRTIINELIDEINNLKGK